MSAHPDRRKKTHRRKAGGQRKKTSVSKAAGTTVSTPAPLAEIGTTGLKVFSGHIDEEFLPQLRGHKAIKVYTEMRDNDATVGAMLFAIEMLMRQVEWRVEAAGDSPQDLEGAEFLKSCMDDMSTTWLDTLAEIMSFLPFGFAVHEEVYKRRNGPSVDPTQNSRFDDGRIGWRKLPGRAQETIERWIFDDQSGEVKAAVQVSLPDFRERILPCSKILLFRTSIAKGSPEGRALDPETPIPTPDGWSTMGELKPGDRLFDERGMIRHVVAREAWSDRPRYRVRFNDGTSIVADAEHVWITTKVWERSKGRPGRARTTREIAESLKTPAGVNDHGIAWPEPVRYVAQHLPVDPWALGLWLGDGTTLSGQISCHAGDAVQTAQLLEKAGYPVARITVSSENGRCLEVRGGFQRALRSLGVLGHKHVPDAYLRGSIPQRIAFLAGLMDSDGHVDDYGRCEFTNTNMRLVSAVAELVRSLGIGASVGLRRRANGADRKVNSYAVRFTATAPVFRLSRKAARLRSVRARKHFYIVAVEPIEPGPTVCIETDAPSHLFLAGESFVPTHNSILRNSYKPWYFKRRIEEIEGIGIERDLAGLPVAWVPPEILATDAAPEDKAIRTVLEKLVRNIRRDEKEGVLFPIAYDEEGKNRTYDLTLLTTGGRRQFDTTGIIDRYDKRIAMTVLADFILMGQGSVGSFALASSKTTLFATALGSWLDAIAEIFNRHAIPRLFALNDFPIEELPVLKHDDIENVNLTELGAYITALSGAGASLFPDVELENHLRSQASLPERAEDDEGEREPPGGPGLPSAPGPVGGE